MKKKYVAGLALLMPLCLLAGCGGGGPTALAISANWYAETTTSRTDFSAETLTYAVTFTGPTTSAAKDYRVEYDEGVYKTELTAVPYAFTDGTSAIVYCYKTRLDITGRYLYRDITSETFTDFVESTVYFRTADKNLRPISSTKTIHSTNPAAVPSTTRLFDTVSAVYTVEYNTAASESETLRSAHITLANASDDSVEPLAVDCTLEQGRSFFDNEQILFAIRGMDMKSAATFSTIDPLTNASSSVRFVEVPTEAPYTPTDLTIGSEAVTSDISACKVRFMYGSAQPGPERTAYYAAFTSAQNNTYRNVLLRLEDPIPGGYGTLFYNLKNAQFISERSE